MKKTLSLVIFIACISCKHESTENLINGLAIPYILQEDSSAFYITDYVPNFRAIDSISFPATILAAKINDSVYSLSMNGKTDPLSLISVFSKNHEENILMLYREKQKVVIQYSDDKKNKNLKVIGSMNYWNRGNAGMKLENGTWSQEFILAPGAYEYLFFSEGKEFTDPKNPLRNGNNSLIRVGKFMPEELPFITTSKYSDSKIELTTDQPLTKLFAFWQNKMAVTSINNKTISIEIPKEARDQARSFIRVWAYNENGISNDILIPLESGKVVDKASQLTRYDKQTMIMYFLMVDRFFNGDTTNDKPVNDKDILPKANYFGGDLAGVDQKIKEGYFSGLGINTVWLSPICLNPEGAYGLYKKPYTKFSGYHGYWPVSNTVIDYRFGNASILKTLINDAHSQQMNVLLDYVAHHVHKDHPVYKLHPDWVTNLYLPDGTLNTEKWDEERLTTWFDTFLPTLDLRRQEVVNAMVDSAVFWFKNYDIDGFRHDATKHIDEKYWRALTLKLKVLPNNRSVYQIGETYGSPILISSYIGSGMLDAQFDFNVYDNATACFALDNESFTRLKTVLSESWKYYGYNNLMGNISGNQDRARFISYAGGELSFSEDTKYAGWNRNIGVGNPNAYRKLKMLHALNMTIPGIPVIYYGDEVGIPGGNDPDNRRWMKFDSLSENEMDVWETVKKLITIRKNNLALLYGQTRILQADQEIFAFTRYYFDEKVLVVFNKSNSLKTIPIQIGSFTNPITTDFGSQIVMSESTLTITLKPLSFEIVHY